MNTLNLINDIKKITSLQLLEQINFFRKQESINNLKHNDLLKVIRTEFEEEISQGNISLSNYEKRGKLYPVYLLTPSQAKQVLLKENRSVRKAVINYIEKLEEKLKAIYSGADTIAITEIESLKDRVLALENNSDITRDQNKELGDAIRIKVYKVAKKLGLVSKQNKLYQNFYKDYKNKFGIEKKEQLPRECFYQALEFIEHWQPDRNLKR